jgi:hypothetical protein
MEVNTHVGGGDPDAGGTSPRVSLVPSVATVRHSRPLPPQYPLQTACSGELPAVTHFSYYFVILMHYETEKVLYSHFNLIELNNLFIYSKPSLIRNNWGERLPGLSDNPD